MRHRIAHGGEDGLNAPGDLGGDPCGFRFGADALEFADAEDALSTWLARHGVRRSWAIAPPLAAAGVDLAWCDRVSAVLPEQALEPALEWVESTVSAATLLSELRLSTRRKIGRAHV